MLKERVNLASILTITQVCFTYLILDISCKCLNELPVSSTSAMSNERNLLQLIQAVDILIIPHLVRSVNIKRKDHQCILYLDLSQILHEPT